MNDAIGSDRERLWRILRAAEPPEGARERVRERIERARGLRGRRRVAISVSAAATASLSAVLWMVLSDDGALPPRVVSVASATQDGRPLAAGQPIGPGIVEVTEAGQLQVALERAEVDVAGPAVVEVQPQGFFLRKGRLRISGTAAVAGPGCRADISGRAAVEVSRTQVVVTVFAGSAWVAPEQTSCSVIDLSRPGSEEPRAVGSPAADTESRAEPAPAAGTEGRAEPAPAAGTEGRAEPGPAARTESRAEPASAAATEGRAEPAPAAGTEGRVEPGPAARTESRTWPVPPGRAESRARPASPPIDAPARTGPEMAPRAERAPVAGGPTDTALNRQVAAYWAAERARPTDPAAALAAFEVLRGAWPQSALRHEVDLAIIDLLVELDRMKLARARAREFLELYPNSARRDDVLRIALGR